MNQLLAASEFVLEDPDRKERFMGQVMDLLKAFALAGASEQTYAIRDDTRFFSDVRSYIAKLDKEGVPGRGGGGRLGGPRHGDCPVGVGRRGR